MLNGLTLTASLASIAHWAIVIALSVRVVMRRLPVGVSLAWLTVIFSIPFAGAAIYLLIGENRLSRKYGKRAAAIQDVYSKWQQRLQERGSALYPVSDSRFASLQHHAQTLVGFPVMGGNRLTLMHDFNTVFTSIISDIEQARESCHLEFYIWQAGGMTDQVAHALIQAATRGVTCRVLVDAIGSKKFLKDDSARQLRDAGVRLATSLPVGPIQILTTRADLRNHRKIVVIDGVIAYTGSQNLVDPRFFKQDEGVGQWIDAMVRIEGPCVEALAGIFIQGWELDTGEGLDGPKKEDDMVRMAPLGTTDVQVVPSGPGFRPDAIRQLLLDVIYSAQRELVITTPYFIPDDTLHTALIAAAHRGVDVILIVPEKVDSRLSYYASRSLYDDLLSAGVRIAEFRGGLLHTKSIAVDSQIAIFGSVNLDMRSLWLDFEISLFIYNTEFTEQLRSMQMAYLQDTGTVDLAEWRQRRLGQRFVENAAHLVGPLL
jgi:cardiolipin synthase A/B